MPPVARAFALAAWLGSGVLVFPIVARAVGPCPLSSYTLYTNGPFTSQAPTLDETYDSGFGAYHVAYDLMLGTVSMSQCCSLPGATVVAVDAYDVTGVPAGTPVAFTAVFTVDGLVWTDGCGGTGCGGLVSIHVGSGSAFSDTTYSIHLFNGSQSFHDVRRLPIAMVAGTPVTIEFQLHGARTPGGAHGSSGDGLISFSDLPAGAGILSCQGYSMVTTVAQRTSWGALKTIYR